MTAVPDLRGPRRVHLVGVGGAGMSGIARVLLQRGHTVSGTDRQATRVLEVLRAMGAGIRVGHDAAAVGDAELVVVSAAVPDDNPEVVAARERGIPVVPRARMLAGLMRGGQALLVAGTHGKTTTTSMLVVALQGAGLDPSFAIGAALNEPGSNAHAGRDELFVAEADESDRSFLVYRPDLAVVTNVELDHPDAFADEGDVRAAFAQFLARRRPGAAAVVCRDDPGAAALVGGAEGPVVTYGEDPRADVRVVPADGAATRLLAGGTEVARYRLAIPGRHNRLNAAAALAACRLLGADLARAARELESFTGAQRRFQRLGRADGVEVVDDYAHHPTELRATLSAARAVTRGRIVLVVQPHRFSRTAVLGEELGRAAAGADVVVVTDVYASGERPVPGVTGHLVAEAAERAGGVVVWQPHLGSVVDELLAVVQTGDTVLVTGAGDVSQVGPALLAALGAGRG